MVEEVARRIAELRERIRRLYFSGEEIRVEEALRKLDELERALGIVRIGSAEKRRRT